jgi:hypothetical protein
MKKALPAAWILSTALTAGCNDEERSPAPEVPRFFRLDATATGGDEAYHVECRIDYVVEISGEVSRTERVIEYVATMGGGASRSLVPEEGTGAAFFADVYHPNVQVLHILPNRIQIQVQSRDAAPDGLSSTSRFWEEIRFWDGVIDQDGVISGEWLCAPLDVEYGVEDDSIFVDGTWQTTAHAG